MTKSAMERALSELRTMFPRVDYINITAVASSWNEYLESDKRKEISNNHETRIVVGQHCSIGEFEGSTLPDAMAKVREWKENNRG